MKQNYQDNLFYQTPKLVQALLFVCVGGGLMVRTTELESSIFVCVAIVGRTLYCSYTGLICSCNIEAD
jgi:3-keto-L-gulonate-6-phosphate decarboxylase